MGNFLALTTRAWAVAAALCIFTIAADAGAAEPRPALKPFSRIAIDSAGDAIADAALRSKVPILIGVGVTYKAANLARDIGAAGVEAEDRLVGAEMILVSEDAAKLKAIKAAGGDLNGPAAEAIKDRLAGHKFSLLRFQRSPHGDTIGSVVRNLPYVMVKVGIGEKVKKAVGKTGWTLLNKIVPARRIPKAVNWALNYGGPLDALQRRAGWGKLGARAHGAERATKIFMQKLQEKAIMDRLRASRAGSLGTATVRAMSALYLQAVAAHPSRPVTVDGAGLATAVAHQMSARQVDLGIAQARMIRFVPLVARPMPAGTDRVALAIEADDAGGWENYAHPVPRNHRTFESPSSPPPTPFPPPPPAAEPDPADEARWQRIREQVSRVGDGKTYSTSSEPNWDGRGK